MSLQKIVLRRARRQSCAGVIRRAGLDSVWINIPVETKKPVTRREIKSTADKTCVLELDRSIDGSVLQLRQTALCGGEWLGEAVPGRDQGAVNMRSRRVLSRPADLVRNRRPNESAPPHPGVCWSGALHVFRLGHCRRSFSRSKAPSPTVTRLSVQPESDALPTFDLTLSAR